MDEAEAERMSAEEPGPMRHTVVVKEKNQQPGQRDIGLSCVVNKGVVFHSQ
jgi:hypothetical protein